MEAGRKRGGSCGLSHEFGGSAADYCDGHVFDFLQDDLRVCFQALIEIGVLLIEVTFLELVEDSVAARHGKLAKLQAVH